MILYTFSELVDAINKNGNILNERDLYEWMTKSGWLTKDEKGFTVPSDFAFSNGLLATQTVSFINGEHNTVVVRETLFTGKGQQYFINLFLKGGNAHA